MEAAERLGGQGAGRPRMQVPPHVQGGAPDHEARKVLASGRSLGGRLGSGLGRLPGVQGGLQRGHIQQPLRSLSRSCPCTEPILRCQTIMGVLEGDTPKWHMHSKSTNRKGHLPIPAAAVHLSPAGHCEPQSADRGCSEIGLPFSRPAGKAVSRWLSAGWGSKASCPRRGGGLGMR